MTTNRQPLIEHGSNNSNKQRKAQQHQKPRLFQPFRALGFVSGSIALSPQARGQTWFLTSCIGSSWMVLEGQNMHLKMVGGLDNQQGDISAILSHQDLTFCAVKNQILIYTRQVLTSTITIDVSNSPDEDQIEICGLCLIGDLILAYCDSNVYIYNYKTSEYFNEIESGKSFIISAMLHPSTYVNKILIAANSGSLQLWNFRSMTMLYQFKSFGSPVTSLVQSPSIDVVAIGLLDGSIILFNIKLNKHIMSFQQEGKVTGISFRTDVTGGRGSSIMASSSSNGTVALWDLEERRLVHLMEDAHDASVHSCFFFHGTNILLTGSADNSIKQWIFDEGFDGAPRLLKSRSGHHQPPTKVLHYGRDGHGLLSVGQDQSLRYFSVIRDAQNCEISQGRLEHRARKLNITMDALRLPQITQFSANDAKQKEWDNILTCHANEKTAKTWSFQRKAIGKHSLISKDNTVIKSVWISVCGNFGFLGSAEGNIDKYNMQSGLYRSTFKGHLKAVTSIVSDNVNMNLVSAGLDHTIKIWDFNKGFLVQSIQLPAAVTHLKIYDDSRLLAVVTDDLCIRVVDLDSFKIVREFKGHTNRITDITFSADGRWLISSSLDTTIRTWDLPTGFLIDIFSVPEICTSVSMSPTGDFICTTHVDRVGLYLWANKSQYAHVPLIQLDDKKDDVIRVAILPNTVSGLDGRDESTAEDDEASKVTSVPEDDIMEGAGGDDEPWRNIQDDFITLSNLPRSRWHNLLNLESIKERNRPKEAPKVPEKAPFFMATLPGALPIFSPALHQPAGGDSSISEDRSMESRVLSLHLMDTDSQLVKYLKEASQVDFNSEGSNSHHRYAKVFQHLIQLSPSAVDLEIRSLPQDLDIIEAFLRGIMAQIETKREFELTLSYLNVFIKIHGDLIRQIDPSLLKGLIDLIHTFWNRLEGKLLYSLCLVEFAQSS